MAGNVLPGVQTLSEQVRALNGHMEEIAGAGKWLEVIDIMVNRDAMLREIEDSERQAALLAARRSMTRVRQIAETARRDVADKLTTLQHGKEATDSYRANT